MKKTLEYKTVEKLTEMITTTSARKLLYTSKLTETSVTPCVIQSDVKLKRSVELSFGLLIAILNIVEIIIIVKIKRKKMYEILLLSLSVSDCMFGLSNSFVSALYIIHSKCVQV